MSTRVEKLLRTRPGDNAIDPAVESDQCHEAARIMGADVHKYRTSAVERP